MTASREDVEQAINAALGRLPRSAGLRIRRVDSLYGNRWGAVIEHANGAIRASISFDEPAESGPEALRVTAQDELQQCLKLCPLCQREGYVQRLDSHATVLFVSCPSCGEYEINGEASEELRKGVARDRADVLKAIPRLIEFVRGANAGPRRIQDW